MTKGKIKRVFLLLCLIATCLLVITGCGQEPKAEKEDVGTTVTTSIPLSIQGVPFTLNTDWGKYTYETALMTTEFPMDFSFGEYEGWEITVDGIKAESGKSSKIQVEKLSKDIAVILKLRNLATGVELEQYIRTLPGEVKDVNVLSQVDSGAYYYAHNGYAFKMNHKGEVVFYYRDPSGDANERYLNEFKKVEIDGDPYYLMIVANNSHKYPNLGSGAGPNSKALVLDKNYYVVDSIDYLYPTDKTPSEIPLDQHDFLMLGKGHYLVCGYVPERVNNFPENVEHSKFGARVVASIIQEIKDGKVIFEWYSTDYPELYAFGVEGRNDYFNEGNEWSDYAHLNSMEVDSADGNLVCSFRNLDGMMKIDRKTGDILWILSGPGDQFGLSEEQKTSRQHDIRKISDNTYSVFDNGNANNQTRVVEYTLNEKEKELVDFKEYYMEKVFSPYQGNAQVLDTGKPRYLVSGGMWLTSVNAFFYDIDFESNEILFEVVPVRSYRSNPSMDMVYRAYRFDS